MSPALIAEVAGATGSLASPVVREQFVRRWSVYILKLGSLYVPERFNTKMFGMLRPASAARDGSKSSVEPRAGRKPLEYEQWERSAGDTKLHTCLSKYPSSSFHL